MCKIYNIAIILLPDLVQKGRRFTGIFLKPRYYDALKSNARQGNQSELSLVREG